MSLGLPRVDTTQKHLSRMLEEATVDWPDVLIDARLESLVGAALGVLVEIHLGL